MPDYEERNRTDELRRDMAVIHVTDAAIIEAMRRDMVVLQTQVLAFEKALINRVERLEFIPVKLIAYALAGGTLTTVMGAVLSKVILK